MGPLDLSLKTEIREEQATEIMDETTRSGQADGQKGTAAPKRDREQLGEEDNEEEEAARQRQEARRKANGNEDDGSGAEDTTGDGEEQEQGQTEQEGDSPGATEDGSSQPAAASGGDNAGYQMTALGLVDSEGNLVNPQQYLYPQGMPYGVTQPAQLMPGQNGFMPGLMPPGVEGQDAAAMAQFIPGFQAAALQQMFQQPGGMDATAASMMMAGFPGMLGAAGMRANVPIPSNTPSISVSLPCDEEHLSEYQTLVRKHLEFFEAQQEDVESNTQGRKKSISLGQVGLRCKNCAGLPLRQRGRGAVYYPTKLFGIYQAAQNMAVSHLAESCQCMDLQMKSDLKALRQRRDTAQGGKQYWADGATHLGLYEAEDGLRVRPKSLGAGGPGGAGAAASGGV